MGGTREGRRECAAGTAAGRREVGLRRLSVCEADGLGRRAYRSSVVDGVEKADEFVSLSEAYSQSVKLKVRDRGNGRYT